MAEHMPGIVPEASVILAGKNQGNQTVTKSKDSDAVTAAKITAASNIIVAYVNAGNQVRLSGHSEIDVLEHRGFTGDLHDVVEGSIATLKEHLCGGTEA